MVKAQIITVARIFDGEIKEDDLVLQEEELDDVQDGEFLVEALFLSVDPYQRLLGSTYKIGQVMIGVQVGKVIESKNPEFPVGETVVGGLGWRTHTIVKNPTESFVYVLPDLGHLPKSLALGVLGGTGVAAYFGFLDICKPTQGDTVVVTAAAGAVGSHVGQIAKIKGCRVIGITGSDEKARWLELLNFDHVINYKTTDDLAAELKKVAPKGIDSYFDNVGGVISNTVMGLMNPGGRVAVCGAISTYNSRSLIKAPIVQVAIIQNQLELKGFRSNQFADRWMEAIHQNLEWVQEKRLKYRETIIDGFENATRALIGVLRGENIGKAVVRVKVSHVEANSVDFSAALEKFKRINSR